MEIVLNKCYGGFSISEAARKFLDLENCYDVSRLDKTFINLVKADSHRASGFFAQLKVVSIPDEATDWEIFDYDGIETLIYVVDGKLHKI